MSEAAVRVERLSDAQAFLDAAGRFLADREAEHTCYSASQRTSSPTRTGR